ncbi:hypothetical protein KUV85_16900 [Nocardioides panacisoli]|uniref:hypothetical protein n=1 Tax=Nocardioides panacisoli TaxID=627624 RepID=UPI001C63A561|nr:hypothetical protein [Nocardioides panacisoli]QYJ03978.1 hypothetical protein KUV85_16900 [Nocardioides panacisoli]
MDDPLPPYTPPIRDQIDLEDLWHELMGRLGFSSPSLWLLLIGPDDRPVPSLTEVADAHELPTAAQRSGLVQVLREGARVVPPGSRFAFLRTRPGRDRIGIADRRWAAMLYAAAREAEVPCETVHAANDVHLVPVPWEDLPAERPA